MFINKIRNSILAVLICFILAGCGITANTTKPEDNQAQRIKTWLSDIRNKVNKNINWKSIESGHHLRLLVVVNDKGYLESINIIESTGNKKLETASKAALLKSEPFQFPDVDEIYRPRLKKMVIYLENE